MRNVLKLCAANKKTYIIDIGIDNNRARKHSLNEINANINITRKSKESFLEYNSRKSVLRV